LQFRGSIVFYWKSGPGLDTTWWNRLQHFQPNAYSPEYLNEKYSTMSFEKKRLFAQKYNADYIVRLKSDEGGKFLVYSNKKWAIYKIER